MSIKTVAPSTKSRSQKKRESRNERYSQSHTYKAYKSNGRWVTAAAGAVVATVGVMSIGTLNVSADSVVTPTSAGATQEQAQTQTSTSSKSEGSSTSDGIAVEVPHDQLDSQVAAASSAGVVVTEKPAVSSSATGISEANKAESEIASSYADQTSSLSAVTSSQVANNNAYSSAVSASNAASSAGSSAIDSANNALSDAANKASEAGLTVDINHETVSPSYVAPGNSDAADITKTNSENVGIYQSAVSSAATHTANDASAINSAVNSYVTASNSVAAENAAIDAENAKKAQEAQNNGGKTIDTGHNGISVVVNQQTGAITFIGIKSDEDLAWVKSRVIVAIDAQKGAQTMDGNWISINHTTGGAYLGALVGGNTDDSVYTAGSGHAHDNVSDDTFTFGDGGFYIVPVTVGDMDTPTGPNSGPIEQHVTITTANGSTDLGPVSGPGGIDGNTGSKNDVVHWYDWTNQVQIHAYVNKDNMDIGTNVTIFGNATTSPNVTPMTPHAKTPDQPHLAGTTYTVGSTTKPIKAKDLQADYQLVDLTVKPQNAKDDDVNGDNISDSGKLISKGSTIHYSLGNDALPAHRTDKATSYVITDTLPDSVHTTQAQVQAALNKSGLSDLYTVKVSGGTKDGGQTVVYTATQKLLDLMNADMSTAYQPATVILDATSTKDNAQFINTFTTSINDYHVTSNKVPNSTPDPKPHKDDLNLAGVNIDGRTVLPGTTNVYKLLWDLSVYKGITSSDDQIAKGFMYLDDFPEEALNVDPSTWSFTDSNGNAVKGLTATVYQSAEDAPANVQAMLKANNIVPKGAFAVILPKDAASFYKDYVEAGLDINIYAPMTVKDTFQGEYKNTAYQFDFGNGYQTETVTNNVPPMTATKSVDDLDGNSIDGQTVKVGDNFKYVLHSPEIPATHDGLGEPLYQAGGFDALDPEFDEYTGQYRFVNTVPVELKTTPSDSSQTALWNELHGMTVNGVLPAGTDLSKYVIVTYGNKVLEKDETFVHDVTDASGKVWKAGETVPAGTVITNVFSWEFTQEFLDQLVTTSGLKYDTEIQVKRLKPTNGDVLNSAVFSYNDVEYKTNTVHTHTPETPNTPDTPQTPRTTDTPLNPGTPTTPATPVKTVAPATPQTTIQPATPVSTATMLPKTAATGKTQWSLGLLELGMLIAGIGSVALKRRKGDDAA
ncbi:MAG: SspB-related isopeptide-forming adhesin [Weissella confusa]|nr:SspB-related isopeptide-forming adhesin [Weissella confusa]